MDLKYLWHEVLKPDYFGHDSYGWNFHVGISPSDVKYCSVDRGYDMAEAAVHYSLVSAFPELITFFVTKTILSMRPLGQKMPFWLNRMIRHV